MDGGNGGTSAERARLLELLRSRARWSPLTATQEGIWLAEELDPGRSGYHDMAVLRLLGPLDRAALGAAFRVAQSAHEALRARIVDVDGEPRQAFDVTGFAWCFDDLASLGPGRAEVEATRLAAGDASEPFDLRTGPLWRARLIRLGPDDHRLVIVLHHLITDGWSHGVFLASVLAGYALEVGVPSPEPPPPGITYPSWLAAKVERERAAAQGGGLETVTGRLSGVSRRISLPGLAQDVGGREALVVPVPVPQGAWNAFSSACRRARATSYMALGGLFALVLARQSGNEAVILSAPLSNRSAREVAGLIGCLIDVAPVRVDVPVGASPAAAVGAGRLGVLDALRHGDTPYRAVARAAGGDPSADDPLTNIGFEEFNAPHGARQLGALRVTPEARTQLRLRHDLSLSVPMRLGDPVHLLVPARRWEPGAVEALAGELASLVGAFAGGSGVTSAG